MVTLIEGFEMQGKISWFDGMSGEGMVRSNDGKLYYLHFTAIQGIDQNNHHFPTELDQKRLSEIRNLPCTFELWVDPIFTQVEKCSIEVLQNMGGSK